VCTRGSESVLSVTRNGQSYTYLDAYELGNTSGDPRVEIWYLVNPPVDTQNVTITMSAASQFEAAVLNFVNVHQFTPFGTFVPAGGTGTAATVTASGANNDLMLDVISAFSTLSVGAGQTSRWSDNADANWHGASSTEPGGASVAMSWTLGGSQKWAMGAVAIKASAQ
jgi:hypothetical protein